MGSQSVQGASALARPRAKLTSQDAAAATASPRSRTAADLVRASALREFRDRRQHIYGAEIASLDGGSLTLRQSRFNLTLFGGRRFTYYSDPLQRAIGGANLLVRLTEKTDVEYQGLYYVLGSHVATIRHRITPAVRFVGRFKAVGGSAVDLSGNVMYLPASGKTSLRFGVWQKLSDDGYTYDYTLIASDQDAFNRLPRLYLGVIPKYTQVTFSGRQELIPRVSVGGGLIVRRLNDADQTLNAYAASFEDYRLSTQIYPTRKYDFILEAHQRNVDRGSPLGATAFDAIQNAGETRAQDFSLELRRSFGEGRVTLSGGAFFRRMDLQNRFFFIEGQRAFGALGGVSYRVNSQAALTADYSLDDDFFIFRPSIQRSQVLRLGWRWRY